MEMPSSNLVTAEELDTLLAMPAGIRFDLAGVTKGLPMDALCELATESTGNTAQTVQGLIEGVIRQYGNTLDDAAIAALNAVAHYHVPKLQETFNFYEALFGAD
ncbi:hypothetical protein [Hydrogenophaga sp.]|uniref:hypothetical protein n=1 Tax=Hydrogenophaga sp. TaxID=1904254 RepID=UPI002719F5EE|nr:hypothetical protein [Hydrogenophaga sp.]MDO8906836.1 hypothetical protein [Hydrogenophaga sp.]